VIGTCDCIIYVTAKGPGTAGPAAWGVVAIDASGRTDHAGHVDRATRNRAAFYGLIHVVEDLPQIRCASILIRSDCGALADAFSGARRSRGDSHGWMPNGDLIRRLDLMFEDGRARSVWTPPQQPMIRRAFGLAEREALGMTSDLSADGSWAERCRERLRRI
jgi:ribonuclease HI